MHTLTTRRTFLAGTAGALFAGHGDAGRDLVGERGLSGASGGHADRHDGCDRHRADRGGRDRAAPPAGTIAAERAARAVGRGVAHGQPCKYWRAIIIPASAW